MTQILGQSDRELKIIMIMIRPLIEKVESIQKTYGYFKQRGGNSKKESKENARKKKQHCN